jgi:hypothetical protein
VWAIVASTVGYAQPLFLSAAVSGLAVRTPENTRLRCSSIPAAPTALAVPSYTCTSTGSSARLVRANEARATPRRRHLPRRAPRRVLARNEGDGFSCRFLFKSERTDAATSSDWTKDDHSLSRTYIRCRNSHRYCRCSPCTPSSPLIWPRRLRSSASLVACGGAASRSLPVRFRKQTPSSCRRTGASTSDRRRAESPACPSHSLRRDRQGRRSTRRLQTCALSYSGYRTTYLDALAMADENSSGAMQPGRGPLHEACRDGSRCARRIGHRARSSQSEPRMYRSCRNRAHPALASS